MTPKEFIEGKEKNKLVFVLRPFMSIPTCNLYRYELEAWLKEYSEIKIKDKSSMPDWNDVFDEFEQRDGITTLMEWLNNNYEAPFKKSVGKKNN